MATLGITTDGARLTLAGGGGDVETALSRALAALPGRAPVVVLIHGYRWDPRTAAADPHRSLFAPRPLDPAPRVPSWPAGLGLDGSDGLCIGFAWPASARHLPTFLRSGRSGFAAVYVRVAPAAGLRLAELIRLVQRHAPWRRVDILAHSLGARVALSALPALDRPPGRLLLLGAAEYASRAQGLLAAGPAPAPAVYNITARSNDLYDALFEILAPKDRPDDRALGAGLPAPPAGWIDLQLDRAAVADWLARRGLALAGPAARACHWSFYTRPGAFALYRAILRRTPGWDVTSLRAEPALAGQDPRWSRLLPRRRQPGGGGPAGLARA